MQIMCPEELGLTGLIYMERVTGTECESVCVRERETETERCKVEEGPRRCGTSH